MITAMYRFRIALRDSDFESNLEQLIHLHIRVINNSAELGICPSRSCYPFVFYVAARNTNAFTTVSSPSGTTDSDSVFRFLFLFCFSTFFLSLDFIVVVVVVVIVIIIIIIISHSFCWYCFLSHPWHFMSRCQVSFPSLFFFPVSCLSLPLYFPGDLFNV